MKPSLYFAMGALLVTATTARAQDATQPDPALQSYTDAGVEIVLADDFTGGVGLTTPDPGNVVVIQMAPASSSGGIANPSSVKFARAVAP